MTKVEEIWIVRLEGDLLYHYPGAVGVDADYLARRLVQTQRFVHDSFAGDEPPRVAELTVGDRRVALVSGRYLVLAVFLKGRLSRRFRERLAEGLQNVETAWEEPLRDWHPGRGLPDLGTALRHLMVGSRS